MSNLWWSMMLTIKSAIKSSSINLIQGDKKLQNQSQSLFELWLAWCKPCYDNIWGSYYPTKYCLEASGAETLLRWISSKNKTCPICHIVNEPFAMETTQQFTNNNQQCVHVPKVTWELLIWRTWQNLYSLGFPHCNPFMHDATLIQNAHTWLLPSGHKAPIMP